MRRGFSLVEVIFAVAIFAIFAVSSVVAVLSGINANRVAGELAVATQYAAEGIDATRSIKNQSFASLVNTSPTTGLTRTGNVWTFSGANNTFDASRYTRTIAVSDVCRDGSNNIVACGSPADTNSKKVVSTVSWGFTSSRPQSVVLTQYFTNWKAAIGAGGSPDDGLLVYGESGAANPRFRLYNSTSNTFNSESTTVAGNVGLNFIVRTSPTKTEAIAGYTNSAGMLQVMCYDGSNWTNEWSVSVGGTGATRRFDISYETNSGDVIVLHSTNVATTNELAYRTKSGSTGCGGSNWSSPTNLDPQLLNAASVVQWVKMAWDRRGSSNLVAAIFADINGGLSSMIWSGTTWGNEPSTVTETSLEEVLLDQDVDSFDVEYESLSGDVMVVWANTVGKNGTNGVRYRVCTGGTSSCAWSVVTIPPTFSDDAHNLDISANPNDDQIIFASIGDSGDDLQVGRWDGSAWVNVPNKDASAQTPVAGSHLVSTGWLISGGETKGIVVYNDSGTTNINYLTMTPGASPVWSATLNAVPAVVPPFGNPRRWYDIQMDPLHKEKFMLVASDVNSDLFAKRLIMIFDGSFTFIWSNSDSSAALETSLGQAITGPFSFAYWRNP